MTDQVGGMYDALDALARDPTALRTVIAEPDWVQPEMEILVVGRGRDMFVIPRRCFAPVVPTLVTMYRVTLPQDAPFAVMELTEFDNRKVVFIREAALG